MHPPVQFRPTDEHLFAHYLERKARGAPLPPGLIEDCDVYSQEPWKIFETTPDQTFYSRGELVGYRKSFKFQGGCGSSATRGRWIMYEFSLCDERQCKYVLCKIKYYGDEKKLEEKAIRACLLNDYGHRTSVICDFALPSSTVDRAQPSASQAVSSNVAYAEQLHMSTGAGWMTAELEPMVHSGYNTKSSSLAPMEDDGSYTNLLVCASSLPPATTTMTTASGPDICDPLPPAFGSNATLNSLLTTVGTEACYASYSPNSLPTAAEQVDDDEWIYRLMNMDIDPVVHPDCHFCLDVFSNPSEDDTNAMLASTLGTPYNQTWDPTSLHQQSSVAESEEQDIPVALAWSDPFLLL
ncbi:hypothetical protein BT93_E0319 [Corymbia citriodora subsp. variegata]|nr:hypothetical protein BT93_E0319 [Corymbia citriodora subsp. variegata]